MDIWLVTHEFPPAPCGGVGMHVGELARELSRRGHQITVVAGRDRPPGEGLPEREESHQDVTVWYPGRPARPGGLGRFLSTVRDGHVEAAVRRRLEARRPDVVHLHHTLYLSMGLPGLLREVGVPLVTTLHDAWPACHRVHLMRGDGALCEGPGRGFQCGPCNEPASGRRGEGIALSASSAGWLRSPLFAYRTWLGLRSLQAMSPILVPSRFLRERVLGWGLSAEDVDVLPTAVPDPCLAGESSSGGSSRETEAPARLRGGASGAGEPFRVGFVGTPAVHKGLCVLAAAIGAMGPGERSVRLVARGRGLEENGSLRREVQARLGEGATLELGGPFGPEEVDRVFRGLHCLAFPSLAEESGPRVLLEARVRGVPVVATRSGAVPEMIAPERDGYLVDRGDVSAMASALEALRSGAAPEELHRPRLDLLGALPRTVDRLEAVYRGLCEARERSTSNAEGREKP